MIGLRAETRSAFGQDEGATHGTDNSQVLVIRVLHAHDCAQTAHGSRPGWAVGVLSVNLITGEVRRWRTARPCLS